MKNDTIQFWNWFKENNKAYLSLDDVDKNHKENLLDTLLAKLHEYCDSLFFQIGGDPSGPQELIITAEGNEDYFSEVERLVIEAPNIYNWIIVAFIQPKSADFQIDFEGIKIKAKEMWFLPLDNPKEPDSIGIRVCLKNYELIKDKKYFMSTIYKIIDTILGEQTFALDIGYLEANDLPDNPEEKKMIELRKLPTYVEWKKEKTSK